MEKNKIKYSILIPTYQKAKYLYFTIKSVLDNNYKDFELIISDDYSTDKTSEVLQLINDERVKIIKPPFKLTQTKNYEFMLNYASGEWISILGDDDGILPNFFEQLDKHIDKHRDIEAIHTKVATYYWDNVQDLYGDRVVDYQNFRAKPEIKNSKLSLFLSLAGILVRTDVPMIYTTGLIKRTLMNRIKKKSENFFFHSLIPDYYSMVCILYETRKYLQINEPIFWVGVSKLSTGRGKRIYVDNSKMNKNELDNYNFINTKLELNSDISETLHMTGLSSIYFFECVLNHPYAKKKWKNKLIKYLVYSSAEISFNKIYKNMRYRIKIDITKQEFIKEIFSELRKNNLSKLNYFIIKMILNFINKLMECFKFYKRIRNFIVKKVKKNPIILVSKNRDKYSNIVDCNIFIKQKLKKN